MGLVTLLAVLTNAIIIAFHSNWMKYTFKKYAGDNHQLLLIYRLLFVLIFEHLVFLIKLVFVYLIPDVPKSIRTATEREQYITKLALKDETPALDECLADPKKISLFNERGELKLPKKIVRPHSVFDITNNTKKTGDDNGGGGGGETVTAVTQ